MQTLFPNPETHAQATTAAIQAIGECIRRLGSSPSGSLYTQLTDFMSLKTYKNLIRTLIKAQKVRCHNRLLEWVKH